MKKLIDFTGRSVELVQHVQKAEGHKTFSSTVLAIIGSYYNGQYSNKRYMDGKGGVAVTKNFVVKTIEEAEKEQITDEQYCEMKGGKVDVRSQRCIMSVGAMEESFPLTDRNMADDCFERNIKAEKMMDKFKPIRYEV